MPKTKISEFDLTAANNTDIDGIDIAEGCAPSGINNAIRELMSQLKGFLGGTSGDLLSIAAGGTNAATTTAALQNLGGTTTGINLFKATDSAAARSAIGAGTGDVTTTGSQVLTNKTISGADNTLTVDGTVGVGFISLPQNSQSAAYTLVASDAGKHIFHPASDNNARTFTIPANSSVPYPVGTAITFINMSAANVTIAITSDTLILSASGSTGSRTLATNGSATCVKITSTSWLISGSGLS